MTHSTLFRRKIVLWLVILLALSMISGSVAAQGGLIGYGQSATGAISAEAPFALYAFSGNAGDHITAVVVGASEGMLPGLALIGPTGSQLTAGVSDLPASTGGSVVSLSFRLQQAGVHNLMVTNTAGTPGQFVLRLDAAVGALSLELSPTSPASFPVQANAQPVRYSFNAALDSPQTLLLSSDTPGFAFTAQVYDGLGQLVARLGGSSLQGASLIVGPGSGRYEVVVWAQQPNTQGNISLLLSSGGAAGPIVQQPAATEEVVPAGCRVIPERNIRVNVRSGPSTQFGIIAGLTLDNPLQVIGQSPDGTWYVVDIGGQRGWVAGTVTILEGTDCATVPFFQSPPTPTPPPATPTPMPTAGPVINFTVNGTGSVTLAAGNCATVAWNVSNISQVYYQGNGVTGVGSSQECPAATTTYTLRVVLTDGTETVRTVSIIISP